MSADSICTAALDKVPKAVACGVVDMGTGMLLAVKTTESHPQAVLDMVAAGTRELYEGEMSMTIESTFKKVRGESDNEHYFQEIMVNSKNLIHYFARLAAAPNVVMAVICRADANLGLVVTKAREIVTSETI